MREDKVTQRGKGREEGKGDTTNDAKIELKEVERKMKKELF